MIAETSVRRGRMRLVPGLEPRPALGEGQRAQILAALEQHVVEADMGRMRFEHGVPSRSCG